ncbi:MAG TPA: CpsD/CapB family tyrosine-protein kinase [Solirubrobacteraceae bacterium]|nr:CpsD/CapB family tyrosine-protein kinase [Solirubrobacteraceae bacterium]
MSDTTDAAAIFAPLWKRKWLIVAVAIVVAGATYLHYKRQPTVFSATTELNLASGVEEQSLLGGNQSKALDTHVVGDAATLIASQGVTEAVHALLRGPNGHSVHGKVRTSVSSSSDVVTIETEAHTAKAAARLANAYAQVYIRRQRSAYLRALDVAIAGTRRQLRRIEAQSLAKTRGAGARGASSTSASAVIQAANLSSKLSQLESELHAAGVQQINPATAKTAALLSPMPKKNALFGFVIGLALAAAAALALDRLDRRLHGLADVEHACGTQVLAALPRAKQPIVNVDGRPALAEAAVEPLWRLRAALALGGVVQNGQVGAPRSILFLSPESGDGKSQLVAGLALVQRDAGERVAVLDADLRRPAQAQLLGVRGYGLADVLAGSAPLSEALRAVASAPAPLMVERPAMSAGAPPTGLATATRMQASGSVSVLASATPAANAPAVIANRAVPELLHSLTADFDCVLIDAPSPLEVSDAMPLLNVVDGIVLVARAGYTRDLAAERLAQLLARSASAPVLGTVVSDVTNKEMARFGISSGYGRRRGPLTFTRR